MFASWARLPNSCLLLTFVFWELGQAQFYISDTCQDACVHSFVSQPAVNGQKYLCTSQGFQRYQSCVCDSCPSSDVSEVNRMITSMCTSSNPGQVSCSGSSSPTSTSSQVSNPTSSGASTPSPISGASSGSGGSSSTSSRRKGSTTGIKAGIGVGVLVGILAILGLLYFVLGRRKYNKIQKQKASQTSDESTTLSSPFYKPELDNTQKPITNPNYAMNALGDQNQPKTPSYTEMPATQPETHQDSQPNQGGLGPSWGEGPITHSSGPTPGH